MSLDKTSMTDKGELTATVTVTNTGKRDGAEVFNFIFVTLWEV